MSQKTETGEEILYIPPNFREGIAIFGFMIRPTYALQAIPFICIILFLVFGACSFLPMKVKIVIALVLCVLVIFLAIVGINGDSLFGFLRTFIRSKKGKRVCLYNDRAKPESRPMPLDEKTLDNAARIKIVSFLENVSKEKELKPYQRDKDEKIFFREDIGIIEKPVELMTAKERKNYERTGKSSPSILGGETVTTYRRKK